MIPANVRCEVAPLLAIQAAFDPIEELPVAYVEIDARGIVTRANRAACAMYSTDQGGIVGRHPWEFAPDGQAELDRNAFFATLNSSEDPPVIRRTLYANGEFRTMQLHRTLMRDAEGRPTGICGASFDVTDYQNAHEEADRARTWMESVLGSMTEAVFTMDAMGSILSANPAAEEMFGWKGAELVGKAIDQVFEPQSYVSASGAQLTFNTALHTRSRGIAIFLDRQHRQVRVEITTSPILDTKSGFISGVVGVLRSVEGVAA
jgi:PAS domain S-box-containing protein